MGPGVPGMPGGAGGIPPKAKRKPNTQLKSLKWSIVEKKFLKGSIWLEIDDSKIDFNIMNFERDFGLKQNTNLKVAEKAPVKKQKVTHLEGGLGTTLEMIMKKNKIEYIDILENLMEYNTDFFTADIIL